MLNVKNKLMKFILNLQQFFFLIFQCMRNQQVHISVKFQVSKNIFQLPANIGFRFVLHK